MVVVPITIKEANRFVKNFHRHNEPVQGARFAIGASDQELGLIGVAIVGRPRARNIEQLLTAEVTRVCLRPDAPRNANSFLYGACWRIWRAMGGLRLVTYTLTTESGASLLLAGWHNLGAVEPVSGKGWQSRPNREWYPVYGQLKLKWEKAS